MSTNVIAQMSSVNLFFRSYVHCLFLTYLSIQNEKKLLWKKSCNKDELADSYWLEEEQNGDN
jgi:hypothetical protein